MSSGVPEELRRLVAARAGHTCEYCLIHEDDVFLAFEVDHIISRKHGGVTAAENLACACFYCNRYKGTDLATDFGSAAELVRLFNPRINRWEDHFRVESAWIEGRTQIGMATAALLKFNIPERLLERADLAQGGRWPSR